jgi:hypothetical protein
MPAGRPTEFSSELAIEICSRIAAGESLRSICSQDDTKPAASTVCLWNLENRSGFSEQYARARQMQAEILADELFEVADDGSNDWVETKFGPQINGEVVQRSRLRVDTRKWYLSKVLPKIYGDKVLNEHVGPDGGPVQFLVKSILEE